MLIGSLWMIDCQYDVTMFTENNWPVNLKTGDVVLLLEERPSQKVLDNILDRQSLVLVFLWNGQRIKRFLPSMNGYETFKNWATEIG